MPARDNWDAAGAVQSLQNRASALFGGLLAPKGKARAAVKTVTAAQAAHNQQMEQAIKKQLVVAMDLQGRGDFSGTLTLLKGVVETSKHYKIDVGAIIRSFPVDMITSSTLHGDVDSYNFLVDSHLGKFSGYNPDFVVAAMLVKDVDYVKDILNEVRADGKSYKQRFFPANPSVEGSSYEMSGPDLAIARGLMESRDVAFVVAVLGDVYSAAKLALVVGSPAFARDILKSISGVDRNLDVPLPAHLEPPPSYVPVENLIDL